MRLPSSSPSGASAPFSCLSLFAGIGGGLLGFTRAGFSSVGAFDCDPGAIRNLERITGCTGHVVDLETISPQELRARCTGRPDVVFTSPPCKGFSSCLPRQRAGQEKYQRLNALSLRGIWLALEAWQEAPPGLILMENVPRIKSRGSAWLDQIRALLHAYGYAVTERCYDCGELAGLGQSRQRFLLMARHMKTVGEFLYEPPRKPLRSIGEVLGQLPVPSWDPEVAGPMHVLPRLQFGTLLRLALVPPGKDWKALPTQVQLKLRGGRQNGQFGVNAWNQWSHTVVSTSNVGVSWASVEDPRVTVDPSIACAPRRGTYGVLRGDQPSGAITGNARHDNGAFCVVDPRLGHTPRSGSHGVLHGGHPSGTVIGNSVAHKSMVVVDPRVSCKRRDGSEGVRRWEDPSVPIIGHGTHHNGPWQVADPRVAQATHCIMGDALYGPAVEPGSTGDWIICTEAGGWHRPLTELEKAALQSFPVKLNGEWFDLETSRTSDKRQWIGNAVPPDAATAIAHECLRTLEASEQGVFLWGGSAPVWVDGELPQEGCNG